MGTCHNPWCPTQGGRAQPHIPASAAPVSWRSRATPRKSAPQNFLVGSREILWRCVMSIEAQEVPEAIPERDFGSLRGCLGEGAPEQRRRERRIRRRSLAISVALQSAILAAAVLLSLFGKAERIVFAKVTPVPPYAPYRDTSHNSSTPRTHPNGPPDPCHYCATEHPAHGRNACRGFIRRANGRRATRRNRRQHSRCDRQPHSPFGLEEESLAAAQRGTPTFTATTCAHDHSRSGNAHSPRRAGLSTAGAADASGRPRGVARHYRHRRHHPVSADRRQRSAI